jgi:nicotinamidase/pyrazinamidase
MKALLLIDIQNDFLPGGALAVPFGDEILDPVNALIPRFELVIASQDWHPANHASFAANHPGKGVGDRIVVDGVPQILWPVHCVQNTPGAALSPALNRAGIHQVVQKGQDPLIDSYSAFYDNEHRRSTGLAELLRARDVSHLFLAGLATDYCVQFSALDALAEGFAVTLVEDAARGVNLHPADVANAVALMRGRGATLTTSAALLTKY